MYKVYLNKCEYQRYKQNAVYSYFVLYIYTKQEYSLQRYTTA